MTALPLIITTHVGCEPTLGMLDLAFARLGGFLDTESATLNALGEALSLPRVGQSLCALHLLRRGGRESDPQVFDTAIRLLRDLRDELLVVPHDALVMKPQALRGVFALKDVDAVIRFMCARIDEQIAALQYALGKV